MSSAATKPKSKREYRTHGDFYRQRLLKERGINAIDGRTLSGLQAKQWRKFALDRKGGKACATDVKQKIEAGAFYLWRALELRNYIIADARERGTPINRRHNVLPKINEQYDRALEQWQRINDELELDKGMDLARRLMAAQANGGQGQ